MNIRHCLVLADLVSLLSSLYFLKHSYLPKESYHLLHFVILPQQCPYVTQILCFFMLFFHWGQSCWQSFIVWLSILHVAFPHVGCWLFLDIKCPWVSLVCPIRILLNLTSYCQQLLRALSHSSMYSVAYQYCLSIPFASWSCYPS